MAITAYMDKGSATRGSTRRTVYLQLDGKKAAGSEVKILLHNISATGLLVESKTPLAVGDRLQINLPHSGMSSAAVVWSSGHMYGCQFETPVSSATLSAAQLRSGAGPVVRSPSSSARNFGARLHRLRVERGLTQSQLADHLGISKPSIWAWEHGKAQPKADRMAALAALLGVDPAELLESSHQPNLGKTVEQARIEIADAAGIDPAQVRISIEM